MLDRELQNPHGLYIANVDNINVKKRPDGTSQDYALRKLRKSAPTLHAQVLARKLSAHAAMIKAGYLPKSISIPITKPEAAAKAIRKHMSTDHLAEFVATLNRDYH